MVSLITGGVKSSSGEHPAYNIIIRMRSADQMLAKPRYMCSRYISALLLQLLTPTCSDCPLSDVTGHHGDDQHPYGNVITGRREMMISYQSGCAASLAVQLMSCDGWRWTAKPHVAFYRMYPLSLVSPLAVRKVSIQRNARKAGKKTTQQT